MPVHAFSADGTSLGLDARHSEADVEGYSDADVIAFVRQDFVQQP